MAPELRPRTSQVKPSSYATSIENLRTPNPASFRSGVATNSILHGESAPPIYTIDLSLPPAERYTHVLKDFRLALTHLPVLLDEIFDAVRVPNRILHGIVRLLLRRVYDQEQHEELKGISGSLGLPMHLLVAYNVLLDLFMGCTSGGARAQPPDSVVPRMMHFRTLDWGMPALRDVVVQYNFVERPGGDVIARTISYVGYVGVLTGVKQNLSVSINFRPCHNDDASWITNCSFRLHQIAVLLGVRPSIASILRNFILPHTTRREDCKEGEKKTVQIAERPIYGQSDIYTTLPSMSTTAAYLIFSTPHETIILEKDRKTAKTLKSSSFIATTNHDESYDTNQDADHTQAAHIAHAKQQSLGQDIEYIIEESVHRKKCLAGKWETWLSKQKKGSRRDQKRPVEGSEGGVPLETLKEWMQANPTSNQETHFVCIMDPARGEFKWVRRYDEGDIRGESGDERSEMGDNDVDVSE
ncbi:hypothetical protein EK21DRAFT_79415 [Setomelanomma holmii]|uniref:ceramidase n=1 Tax=Setomelanomma holmii TaxID=210430 RepID=A0A9P4GZ42_9PLEO|nr:hypothetical protein EK21DRAFT_79415 [Setomelanomma holmii]